MATISKFFQVTNQLLLEYKSDKYKTTVTNADAGDTYTSFIMYQGNNGLQYCLDTNNISHWKLPDATGSQYFYPGRFITEADINTADNNDDEIYGNELMFDGESHGVIIKDVAGNQIRHEYINHDKIRIYLLAGYILNAVGGIAIRVKAKVNYVYSMDRTTRKRISDNLTVLDWFMPKEMLKDDIHWMTDPLYLNSKFYDRYIEISFPSPLDSGYNIRNLDYVYMQDQGNEVYEAFRGYIDPSSSITIEFSTIMPEYLNLSEIDANDYESRFTLDIPKVIGISPTSNANYFNIRLLEDKNTNSILYYPVYGDEPEANDLTIDVMYAIEAGNIPMIDNANYDSANDGMDDFIEMYGDSMNKWVIINELAISYNYRYIIEPDMAAEIPPITEYLTNTIDYTGKTDLHGQFWRSRFVPYPKKRNGMEPTTITLKYTAHLYNRMNGMDIIRTASITIDAAKYITKNLIEIPNVNQFKIINKIYKSDATPVQGATKIQEKYIRSYYDITNLVVKDVDTGQMYTQGRMTLRLKHSSSNYMLRLYVLNDDNVRVPFNMAGTALYKLTFPSINGQMITVYPNSDSENNNLGIGSLVFYISAELSKQIMSVPESERYFSLMTDNGDNNAQETTLYEGKVAYYD